VTVALHGQAIDGDQVEIKRRKSIWSRHSGTYSRSKKWLNARPNVPFHENSRKRFTVRNDAGSMEANDGVGELGHTLDVPEERKRFDTYVCVQSEAGSQPDWQVRE